MTTVRRTSILAFLAALVALAPGAVADSAKVALSLEKMNVADQTQPPPFQPSRLRFEVTESGPEVPAETTDVLLGTFDVAGASLAVAVGKSAAGASAPDVLYVDANRDGAFAADEKLALNVSSGRTRDGRTLHRGNNLDVVLTVGGKELPFVFAYSLVGTSFNAQLIAVYFGSATVTVGETEYAVFVLDGDQDGAFDGEKDVWTIRPAGEAVTRPEGAFGMTAPSEKRFLDGHLLTLSVTGDEATLTFEAAEGPDPASMARHRERVEEIWFDRFEEEREDFVKQRSLDTARPLAETPVHWNYVTYDEALAMAKEQGRPLFVDVMAFWCVWCYRMDFYTYPDQAVAKLLNDSFVPVKIIQEQDQVGDYDRVREALGAGGIPAMGVWSSDGTLVKKISGWSSPADFEGTLKSALEEAGSADGSEDEPGEEMK